MFMCSTMRTSIAYLFLLCTFTRQVVSLPIYAADADAPYIFIIPESLDLPPPASSIYELRSPPHLHASHRPLLSTSPFPPPFRPLHQHHPRSTIGGPGIVFITLGALVALVMLTSATRCALDYFRGPRHTGALTSPARERLVHEMATNAQNAQHRAAPHELSAPPPYDERAPPSYSSADGRGEAERASNAVP